MLLDRTVRGFRRYYRSHGGIHCVCRYADRTEAYDGRGSADAVICSLDGCVTYRVCNEVTLIHILNTKSQIIERALSNTGITQSSSECEVLSADFHRSMQCTFLVYQP